MKQSGRLWYEYLRATLERLGYRANAYEPCVLCRHDSPGVDHYIVVYVDDIMLLSTDVVEHGRVQDGLRDAFNAITVSSDKSSVTKYLGMVIRFNDDGSVRVSMEGYVADLLKHSPGVTLSNTPYSDHLFEHRDISDLTELQSKEIRSMVAKLLYLAKRVRPDLLLSISVLVSRVNSYNSDDQTKLEKVISYLRSTKDLCLTLRAHDPTNVTCYVDAGFAPHADAKSHSAYGISLGEGFFVCRSAKQRIVTKSSTEAELVAANEAAVVLMWCMNFLTDLGIKGVRPCKLHEDNQSTIHIIKGGLESIRRTRHMNVQQRFLSDMVIRGEMSVISTPTEEMVVDILTQPMRGPQLVKLRNLILNVRAKDLLPNIRVATTSANVERPPKANVNMERPLSVNVSVDESPSRGCVEESDIDNDGDHILSDAVNQVRLDYGFVV